jgi:hypothetical protein
MIQYTIDDFNSIIFNGINFQLPIETIELINSISTQVGATDYIKTPQFLKKNNEDISQPFYKYKKTHKDKGLITTQEDWDLIRKFQITEIKKKQGIDSNIDQIRKYLNKITERTYDKLFSQICEELDKIGLENIDELNKLGEIVFTISSGNIVYSNIYSHLYKELINRYDFMFNIFNNHIAKIPELFISIEYCSPNTNYDKFCENNLKNTQRRALCMFYINLMKENIISETTIINIILQIQSYFMEKIIQEETKEIADELSEILHIFIINTSIVFRVKPEWVQIVQHIRNISTYKTKDFPSITNKSIFKHMDILDELHS